MYQNHERSEAANIRRHTGVTFLNWTVKYDCCGRCQSFWVYLCETEPSVKHRQNPECLCDCSPQSAPGSQQEFHTVIFVLKDTMPCQQDRYCGARFHRLLSDNGRLGEGFLHWPWHHIGACHAGIVDHCVLSLLPLSESLSESMSPVTDFHLCASHLSPG